AGDMAGQGGGAAGFVDQDVGTGGQVGDLVADDGVAGDDDDCVGGGDPVGDGAGDRLVVHLGGVHCGGAVRALPDAFGLGQDREGGQVEPGRRRVDVRHPGGDVVVERGEHQAHEPGGGALGGHDRQRPCVLAVLVSYPAGHRHVGDVLDVVAVH